MSESKVEWFRVLGIPISAVSPAMVSRAVLEWSKDGVGRFIAVRDSASLMLCSESSQLRALHEDASLVLPDGMPIAWIGKWRGLNLQRTTGPDIFELVMRDGVAVGIKHFLYGGKPGVAEELANTIAQRIPGVQVVGIETPPFRELTEQEAAEIRKKIIASGADVVWVGISSPKQELWMHKNFKHLKQTLIGVGAAFDFHTGRVTRAPKWVQTIGFEWIFRLTQEPKRLWRRYLILVPQFLWRVFRSSFQDPK